MYAPLFVLMISLNFIPVIKKNHHINVPPKDVHDWELIVPNLKIDPPSTIDEFLRFASLNDIYRKITNWIE